MAYVIKQNSVNVYKIISKVRLYINNHRRHMIKDKCISILILHPSMDPNKNKNREGKWYLWKCMLHKQFWMHMNVIIKKNKLGLPRNMSIYVPAVSTEWI